MKMNMRRFGRTYRKKIISGAVFALLLISGAFYVSKDYFVFAGSNGAQNDCTWTISDDGLLKISPKENSCTLSNTNGKALGWAWYNYRENYTNVEVDNGVKFGSDLSYIFADAKNLKTANSTNWDLSRVQYLGSAFRNTNLEELDVSNWNVSAVKYFDNLFEGAGGPKKLDTSKWNTAGAVGMHGVFMNSEIEELDVSNWNLSHVTSTFKMFAGATKLKNIDVSKWDMSRVTDIVSMFENVTAPELKVEKWDVSKVKALDNIFAHTKAENLDVKNWDTSAVRTMSGAFTDTNVKELNLSGWDTSSVTNMSSMFANNGKLEKVDISTFSTNKDTKMAEMFSGSDELWQLSYGKNFNWNTPESSMPNGGWGEVNDGDIIGDSRNTTYISGEKYPEKQMPSDVSEVRQFVRYADTSKVTFKSGKHGEFDSEDNSQTFVVLNSVPIDNLIKQQESKIIEVRGWDFNDWSVVVNQLTSEKEYTAKYNRKTSDVSINIEWNDGNNKDKIRPDSQKVQLLQNGEPIGDIVGLGDNNNWSYIWKDLPDYSEDGVIKYIYTIASADKIDGYNIEMSEDGNNFRIIGEHVPTSINDESGDTIDNNNPLTIDDVLKYIAIFTASLGVLALVVRYRK